MTLTIIGWAIVHSLWQGGIIVTVAGGLLAATRKASPQLRYCIALAALGLMLVLPVATAMLKFAEPSLASPSLSASTEIHSSDLASSPIASSSATESQSVLPVSERAIETSPAPAGGVLASAKRYVDSALPWLVVAWMLGLLFSSAKLIGGFAKARRITRRSTSPASRALEIRLEKISERLGINRFVRTLESTAIEVPLVIGAVRPVIVVPASLITGLTPLQLDMLLAHELAHVRRHDYLINLAQTVVETLLFYHPAARWISERAREERENCCDDIAIAACDVDAAQYTTALLMLEESRGAGFGLAAAANGGSLLRRAQRILTGTNPYAELGPRWIAGVITIGAALFTGRDAIAGIHASYAPSFVIGEANDSSEKKSRNPDMSRAAPSTVTKAPTGNPLAERWRWAERNAGSGTYWIGYLVGGDPTGRSRYYNSDVPMRIGGNVTISGRINLGDGDLSNMIFHGVPLSPLVGRYSPLSTAIFVQVSNGVVGKRVDRVHVGTFALPQYFDRRPLVWLDSAADGESLALIQSLMASARDQETRRDLVAAIGVHRDRNQVDPILIGILGSSSADGVRKEAAQWLGHSREPRAMTALSRAVRTDRAREVRKEAVEAFGHMDTAAATDSLIALASTITDREVRREAIEALGHRADERALSYLTTLVRSSESYQMREDALEALSEMPGGAGLDVVVDVAQRDPHTEIRKKAVEEVAHIEPSSRAFDVLTRIAASDPDESVRAEAVEAIAEVHDPRSVAILAQIANRNASTRVQVEAVEALGETVDPRSALPVLQTIARSHPVAEARKKALESIVNFRDEKTAIDALIQSARTDPDENVREEALEALGDAGDPVALKALETLVRSNESLELREKALDVYANSASGAAAVALLKSIIDSNSSMDLRVRAVELLEEVADNSGVAALGEIARSNRDQRLRDRATEILSER